MEYTGRYWHDGYHYVTQDSMSQTAVVSRMEGDYVARCVKSTDGRFYRVIGHRLELTTVEAMPSWNEAIDYARKLTRAVLRETVWLSLVEYRPSKGGALLWIVTLGKGYAMEYVNRELMLRVALQFVSVFKRERAGYAEYRSWWLRRGYLPPYCPHGRYLWTDYDPICQYCEDGDPGVYRLALDAARARVRQAEAMGAAVRALSAAGMAQDIQAELMRRTFDVLRVDDTP